MTGQLQTRLGGLTATRVFQDGASSAVDLSNVIPFARGRRVGAEPYTPPVTINPADRLALLVPVRGSWLQALLLLISLIAHSGLFYLFWQEPQPLLGIGTETITVELEIGDSRPVGTIADQGVSQVQVDYVDEIKGSDNATEDQKGAEAGDVKPEEIRTQVAKEQPAERPKEQKPDDRPKIAMVETQQAEVPTVRPREAPPEMQAVIAPPQEQVEEVKPVESRQRRQDLVLEERAASGVGLVVSASAMASYNGRVFAHIKRHQQYPDAAKNKLVTGKGSVTFAIDASGRVTSTNVAVSSGSTVLDQEMTAMAFRASPFPAPPDGQPKRFTAQVVFEFTKPVR
jgi:periplasmic protein TonB